MLLCSKITVSKHAWALSNLHFVVGSDSVLKTAVSDPKINGKRIFVFIIGGMTRSELRVAHKLTPQLKREVVLGSTNLDDPKKFIRKVKGLNSLDVVEF
jgi:syntaxin-binding protein 1